MLKVGPIPLQSRLILGTGKYPSPEVMVKCHEASGTDMVTVAVRRVDLNDKTKASFLNWIDRSKIKLLPNTAGCYTADDAIRTAMLGREALSTPLVKEGFVVMPYTSDDVVMALRLEEAGAACVMPLGGPIGSGLGILNPTNIRMIVDRVKVPVIVDAGVGTASDVSLAMELGAAGVLLNTAVAAAKDPVKMA